MENSNIEWTDHTFNPWEGCTKVSPGCAHCYAETRNARWNGGTAPNWGKGAPRRRTRPANWRKPLVWNGSAGVALTSAQIILAAGDGKTNHVVYTRVGKNAAGRLLDGVEHSAFPITAHR